MYYALWLTTDNLIYSRRKLCFEDSTQQLYKDILSVWIVPPLTMDMFSVSAFLCAIDVDKKYLKS